MGKVDLEVVEVAIGMYVGEPCRICQQVLTRADIGDGAVSVGYSEDNSSRAAHRVCYERLMDIVVQNWDAIREQVLERTIEELKM